MYYNAIVGITRVSIRSNDVIFCKNRDRSRGDQFKPRSGSISIHRFQNCCCEVVSEAQDFRAVLLTKAVTPTLQAFRLMMLR
jgi:hypothetical protein